MSLLSASNTARTLCSSASAWMRWAHRGQQSVRVRAGWRVPVQAVSVSRVGNPVISSIEHNIHYAN